MKKLFSVVVVTYNQEEFIKECLTSIYEQSYKPMELIIADDHSTDNTVKVVERWGKTYKSRFENFKIIVQPKNIGISANLNSGLKNSTGEYVKCLGGDDLLLPNAISKISEFLDNTGAEWGCGLIIPFYDTQNKRIHLDSLPLKEYRNIFSKKAFDQFRFLVRSNFIPAPGTFFRRNILYKYDYFDTDFNRLEDWPTWLKLTYNGIRVHLLEEPIVCWRKHKHSISTSAMHYGDVAYFENILLAMEKYIFPYVQNLDILSKVHIQIKYKYYTKLVQYGGTFKAHKKARLIKLLDPLWWLNFTRYLRRKITNKDYRIKKTIFD